MQEPITTDNRPFFKTLLGVTVFVVLGLACFLSFSSCSPVRKLESLHAEHELVVARGCADWYPAKTRVEYKVKVDTFHQHTINTVTTHVDCDSAVKTVNHIVKVSIPCPPGDSIVITKDSIVYQVDSAETHLLRAELEKCKSAYTEEKSSAHVYKVFFWVITLLVACAIALFIARKINGV